MAFGRHTLGIADPSPRWPLLDCMLSTCDRAWKIIDRDVMDLLY